MAISGISANAALSQSLQLTQNMALQSLRQVAAAEQALASVVSGATGSAPGQSAVSTSSAVGSMIDIKA